MWRNREVLYGLDGACMELSESDEFLDLTWDGGWTEAVDHGNTLAAWMLDYQFAPESIERGHLDEIHPPSPRVIRE